MNTKDIRDLIRMLDKSGVAEFSLEKDGFKIFIRKEAALYHQLAPASSVQTTASVPATIPEPVGSTAEPARSASDGMEMDNTVTIVAPMVGTFYRAPAPDAATYVEVGDEVEIGQPLCIIEAMKLMNEIESEVRGRVIRILVENAQPVEYGQPLFIIAGS